MSLRQAVNARCLGFAAPLPRLPSESLKRSGLVSDKHTAWDTVGNPKLLRTHGTTGLDDNGILKIRVLRGHFANNAANPGVRHTFSKL